MQSPEPGFIPQELGDRGPRGHQAPGLAEKNSLNPITSSLSFLPSNIPQTKPLAAPALPRAGFCWVLALFSQLLPRPRPRAHRRCCCLFILELH